jgi:chitinase
MVRSLLLSLAATANAAVDIIGYYGNAGSALDQIPVLADVHPNYNVLILTFASIDSSGAFTLDIQGPYANKLSTLAADVKAWKEQADPFGRKRLALISIGGQNGNWPSGVDAGKIEAGLESFMAEFNLDGLDVDLEGQAVAEATSLVPVIDSLTSKGKVVTAAPEAADYALKAYKSMLSHLTWVHPQFYNNGPNAVADPFVPDASKWPTPWTVTDWQAESQGEAFWAGTLAAIGKATGLSASQQGMLMPATTKAANMYNNWNIDTLASQVKAAGVQHVGTWAIAYDHGQDWKFAKALGALNAADVIV